MAWDLIGKAVLVFAGIGGASIGLRALLGCAGVLPKPFEFLTWVIRLRYGIVLTLAPLLTAVAAYKLQQLLLALLLVRRSSAIWDMAAVTTMSFLTAGLGIAICRLITLHAPERFPSTRSLIRGGKLRVQPLLEKRQAKHGWPFWLILLWWLAGIALPLAVIWVSHKRDNQSWLEMGSGLLVGILIAQFSAFIVAVIQRWTLGHIDGLASAGILPFERWVEWIPPWKIAGKAIPGGGLVRWLFGRGDRGFSWLLRGPGFTDRKTGVLLPGHAQMLIVAAVSMAVYLLAYGVSMADVQWTTSYWPTAFYALVILFIAGWFMSGVAFWLDRYGLPPTLFAFGYVALMYWCSFTDHYFQLNPRDVPRATSFVSASAAEAPDPAPDPATGDNVFVAAWKAEGERDELYLADVLEKWRFPGPPEERTLVVVTASGGGIQASAWTAKVLTELDAECPHFSQSVGMISSVSGGSAGTMFYMGHRGIRDNEKDQAHFLDRARAKLIVDRAKDSSLEACAWGVAFPDLVRTIVPPALPDFGDRGLALESVWWNRIGRDEHDRRAMSEVSLRDLIPLIREGRMPAIVFNATCVETGQRVQISPLHVEVAREAAGAAAMARQAGTMPKLDHQTNASTPIDFLQFYDELGMMHDSQRIVADPRITTAVRLSASFSYVTPVARPHAEKFGGDPDLGSRFNYHFCDGGYADNPGLVTAVRMISDLLQHYRRRAAEPAASPPRQPPFRHVLIVRIEPFPEPAAKQADDNRGFMSAVFGPAAALAATRTSSQAERGELELALLQQAYPRSAEQSAETEQISVDSVTFRFNPDDGSQPALSWTLSDGQKRAIDEAWVGLQDHWSHRESSTADTLSPADIGKLLPAP